MTSCSTGGTALTSCPTPELGLVLPIYLSQHLPCIQPHPYGVALLGLGTETLSRATLDLPQGLISSIDYYVMLSQLVWCLKGRKWVATRESKV